MMVVMLWVTTTMTHRTHTITDARDGIDDDDGDDTTQHTHIQTHKHTYTRTRT